MLQKPHVGEGSPVIGPGKGGKLGGGGTRKIGVYRIIFTMTKVQEEGMINLKIIMLSKRQQGELQRSCPLKKKRKNVILQSTLLTVSQTLPSA